MRNLYTNHGLVLMRVWIDPDATLAEIAADVGIKERAAYVIVRDLEREGFLTKRKVGRRNAYHVDIDRALGFQPLPNTTVRQQIVGLALSMGMRLPEGEPVASR